MANPSLSSMPPKTRESVVLGAAGFFGTLLGILVLPKLFKFTFRRIFSGFFAEVVMIVLTGLLAEKAVDMVEKNGQH